jgi:UDP-N-acetylmuramyl tripeptide synthase
LAIGITANDLQIGGRFNAANLLLALVALRGI